MDLDPVRQAPWIRFPRGSLGGRAAVLPAPILSGVLAYLAVAVNAVEACRASPHRRSGGIARRMDRGLAMTGLSGVLASCLGVVGMSGIHESGVILVTRVASRRALAMCGGILMAAGWYPGWARYSPRFPEGSGRGPRCGAGLSGRGRHQHRDRGRTETRGPRLPGRRHSGAHGNLVAALPPAFLRRVSRGLGSSWATD